MSPYRAQARFCIGVRRSAHAFQFHRIGKLPGPARISVCGMARGVPSWTLRKPVNSLVALCNVSCGLCKQVLSAYYRRER